MPDEGLTPESAAAMAEHCEVLLAQLPNDSLRNVALLKLEGYSNDEIAAKLGVVTRTVERKLAVIRQVWEGAIDAESE